MTILSGLFWTLFGMFAQVGFIAGLAAVAYWFKCRIEAHHDREDERKRRNRP